MVQKIPLKKESEKKNSLTNVPFPRIVKEPTNREKKMSKKVLILSGSPRKGGNSETLCEQFAAGAAQAGHEVEILHLGDCNINFCKGCCVCQNSGRCPWNDDGEMVSQKLLSSDVIVLSTPVYFYTMSAQLKTAIDRSIMVYPNIKNKDFYFIMTMGDTQEENFKGTLEALRGFVLCCEDSREKGVISAAGVYEKGEVKASKAMQEAFDAGKNC